MYDINVIRDEFTRFPKHACLLFSLHVVETVWYCITITITITTSIIEIETSRAIRKRETLYHRYDYLYEV